MTTTYKESYTDSSYLCVRLNMQENADNHEDFPHELRVINARDLDYQPLTIELSIYTHNEKVAPIPPQADRVSDQLLASVQAYDLPALLDLWNHLEKRFFARLEVKIKNLYINKEKPKLKFETRRLSFS